jgi:hypothetical protein
LAAYPPEFNCNIPVDPIVDETPKSTPLFNVTLLNVVVPVIVPVPANIMVPDPPVNVLVPLANVPPLAIVSVPPLVSTTEPLFVKFVVVMVPDAPKVKLLALFIVIELEAFVTVPFTVTKFLIIVGTPAGGTAFKTHVDAVFQSPS